MNRHLFIYDIRQNYLLFAIIAVILMMYFSIVTNMYDPAGNEELIRLASMKLSPELVKAFGFEIAEDCSLVSFLSSYLYGMLMLVLPLLYSNITANRLLARHVERKDMAFLMSAPLSRTEIALTQGMFLMTSTWLLIIVCCIFSSLLCRHLFPDMLDLKAYARLNAGLAGLMTLISGIGFLASAGLGDSRKALGIGIGVPMFFYIVKMAADASGSELLEHFTIFSLFENTALANGEGNGWKIPVMFVTGILLYAAGIFTFRQRDLSI